jgi:hypothetical protein
MRDMRDCSKTHCSHPASTTIVLRYGEREVRIVDLTMENDRNLVDLCSSHANRLKPPLGWDILDDRAVMAPSELV